VFHDQDLERAAAWPDRFSVLRIDEGSGIEPPTDRPRAALNLGPPEDGVASLAACARFFAGWNLAVCLVGYLQGITFAGQPAVEMYKAYARRLRDAPGDLPYPAEELSSTASGRLSLYSGAAAGARLNGERSDAGAVLVDVIRNLESSGRLGYFDLTLNADPAGPLWDAVTVAGRRFANQALARPVKIRSGPRDYHSTEQSETAGPPELLSVRILVQDPEPATVGDYSSRFLHAQALGTVFAMRDAGRPVLLATVRRADAASAVEELLDGAAAAISPST
jgi:hypothetical protein